MVIKYMKIK